MVKTIPGPWDKPTDAKLEQELLDTQRKLTEGLLWSGCYPSATLNLYLAKIELGANTRLHEATVRYSCVALLRRVQLVIISPKNYPRALKEEIHGLHNEL